eukprot:6481128-Pyramimonas_sp.AAC.1
MAEATPAKAMVSTLSPDSSSRRTSATPALAARVLQAPAAPRRSRRNAGGGRGAERPGMPLHSKRFSAHSFSAPATRFWA